MLTPDEQAFQQKSQEQFELLEQQFERGIQQGSIEARCKQFCDLLKKDYLCWEVINDLIKSYNEEEEDNTKLKFKAEKLKDLAIEVKLLEQQLRDGIRSSKLFKSLFFGSRSLLGGATVTGVVAGLGLINPFVPVALCILTAVLVISAFVSGFIKHRNKKSLFSKKKEEMQSIAEEIFKAKQKELGLEKVAKEQECNKSSHKKNRNGKDFKQCSSLNLNFRNI